MKFTTYGFDVICLAGELRFHRRLTRQEIAEELYTRGVRTTDRNAQLLYERYLALLEADIESHGRIALKQVIETHGGLILSVNGVQQVYGNNTLYAIREVFSGAVLAARNLNSGQSGELRQMIRAVVGLGFPVVGIVIDEQPPLPHAFEQWLPGVPHRYCPYHFLKNTAHPGMRIYEDAKAIQAILGPGLG